MEELAPSSYEDFLEVKNDSEKWSELQKQYKILDMYKIDSGYLSKTEIYQLDDVVFHEKRNNFISDYKKSGNIAGTFWDDNNSTMYYAHSAISKGSKGYKGNAELIPIKDHLRFSYIDVIKSDGTIRTNTWLDTEAKLFEYFADLYEIKPFHSITMLSERGMCDSCKGVMMQFKSLYPDVTVYAVSNKNVEGNVWGGRE